MLFFTSKRRDGISPSYSAAEHWTASAHFFEGCAVGLSSQPPVPAPAFDKAHGMLSSLCKNTVKHLNL